MAISVVFRAPGLSSGEDLTAPAKPTNFVVTPGDGVNSLTWTNPADADLALIRIYRSTTSGSGHTLLTEASPLLESYDDEDVVNDTTYYYYLTAIDEVPNESSPTDEESGTPTAAADVTAPAAPTEFSVTPGDTTNTLVWTDPLDSDLAGVRVYRSTTQGSGHALLDTVAAGVETYSDESLTNGTTYYYYLTAIDEVPNESPQTAEQSGTPVAADVTAPSAPTGFSVTAGELVNTLAWTDPADGDLAGVRVYRSTTTGTGHTVIATVNPGVQTYDDEDVTAEVEYFYYLTAIDEVPNESTATAEDSGTPTAPAASESDYVIAAATDDVTYKPGATAGTRLDNDNAVILAQVTNWHHFISLSLGAGDGVAADATASAALLTFTNRLARTNVSYEYNIYGALPTASGAVDVTSEAALDAAWSSGRTTAFVNVVGTNEAHAVNDTLVHDIATVINEVVAHADYVAGQDVVLLIENVAYTDHTAVEGNSIQAYSYDNDPAKAPALAVTWTASGVGGGGGEASSQQQIADTYLGTDGWALLNQGQTPDPSWTTVALGDLQTALSAASNGDVLYLAGGDHDASDGHFSCTAAITLLGNYDGTTRITGYKDLTNETWTDNGNGTWSLDVGALGLNIRGEDTAASPLQQGEGNARNAWPQMILKNEQIGHHYATTTALANGTLPDGKYDFPGGGEGYHLDETTDVVSINYDPATADSIYLAYSQGLLHLTDTGCTIKGITFAFDASNNRGPDLHNSSTGPKYAVVVGGGEMLAEYCDFDKNHAGGIRNWGGGSMMRNNRYRWNGMNGLNFQGSPRSVLINCEVYRNGWTSNSGDVGGGMKFKQVAVGDPAEHLPYTTPAENYITADPGDGSAGWDRFGTLVYRIWTHENYGPGIWFDGDCIWSQVENNLCEDDWGSGILYEICDTGLIRWNHVYRCGSGRVYEPVRGGIALSTSNGTATHPLIAEENYVEDCIIGLLMIRASRGTQYECEYAEFNNNHVKTQVPLAFNDVWNETTGNETSPKGARGTNPSGLSMDPSAFNLNYSGNYYEMSSKAFNWENTNESEAAWASRFPSDNVGTPPSGVPTLAEVGLYVPPELA